MKKRFVFGVSNLLILLGLIFVSCNNKSNLSGIWEGTVYGYNATVTITASEWSISIPKISHTDNGTFTRDGNIGILYSSNLRGGSVGNAILKDRNTISITLNSNSVAAGTYSLTRKNENVSGSISNKLIGKWEFQKIITPNEEITFSNEDLYVGVLFERNGYILYVNGSNRFGFRSAYTKGNKIYYTDDGTEGEWSIKNGILTERQLFDHGEEITIAKKVKKFSWE